MSHLSDKDLDHLAREAAEQLDVDQNSSGWEALQSKLDVEMPVEKRRRRWIFLLLIPLIGGLFFLGYKYYQAPGPIEHTNQSTDSKSIDGFDVNPLQPSGNSKDGKSINPDNNIGKLNTDPLIKEPGPGESAEAKDVNVPATASSTKKESNKIGSGKQSLAGKSTITSTSKNTKGNTTNTTAAATATGLPQNTQPEPTNNPNINEQSKSAAPVDSMGAASNSITKTDSSLVSDKVVGNDSTPVSTSSAKTAKKKSAGTLMPFKGFVGGIFAGPDVSEVNGKGTDKTGLNIGISAGYRFNGRLSLLSGLNYTHKYYTAYGTDYKPAKGTWLDTVSLSKVVGECFMFELPINVRYDLIASKKNYAFISAGLSSYFMQQEDYDFHYTTNSGSYGSRYRSYKVSDQYWFSVLNLSGGYERMLNKRLSVQVEPYIKLPLDGLGFGNMELNSYGVFIGVRYHTGSLKSR